MIQHILMVYNPNSLFFIGKTAEDIDIIFSSLIKKDDDFRLRIYRFNPKIHKRFLSRIENEKPDAVWVAGGDGTIISVVRVLNKYNIPIGVLPFGTMNLLARDLGMDMTIAKAVEQLKQASTRSIDLAFVNGHPFLNICNIGISTNFTQMRERLRHQSPWIMWPLLCWYMIKSIFIYPAMTVEVRIKGKTVKYRTRSVSISNNPLSEKTILFPTRASINQGLLGFYIAQDNSTRSIPLLMLKLLIGTWSYDSNLSFFYSTSAVIVQKRKRRFKIMIDGELHKFKGPVRFKIKPGAVSMLFPPKLP